MKKNNFKVILATVLLGVTFSQQLPNLTFAYSNTLENSRNYNNEIVNIPDANLRKALNEKYLKQKADAEITKSQLLRLKGTLYLGASNISDLTGLENCKGVTGLFLSYNSITDLSPLKNLKNLKRLNLTNQDIKGKDVVISGDTAFIDNVIKGIDGKYLAPARSKDYTYNPSNNKLKFENINETSEKIYDFNSKISFNGYTTYFSGKVSQNVIKQN